MGKLAGTVMAGFVPTREMTFAPGASACAVLVAGAVTFALVDAGPLSIQMAQHLAVMNIAAPLIALGIAPRLPSSSSRHAGPIWLAGAVQIAMLWAWHTPSVQLAAAGSFGLHIALMAGLAAVSIAFWALLIRGAAANGWSALGGLLITGKLACLLGALMIFASRDLYLLPGLSIPFCTTGPSTLEDQQLAGLLMITACPLSYLVAGVVLAAQMFTRLDRAPTKPGHRGLATG